MELGRKWDGGRLSGGEGAAAYTHHRHYGGYTDEPFTEGLPFQKRDDLTLQKGMTLTVDFPYMEPGWGACHLEDLVVFTNDGAEALGRMDGPLYVG